jgi:hypothetical protein
MVRDPGGPGSCKTKGGSPGKLWHPACVMCLRRERHGVGDHFYVDLVFYNRLLRCFVLVDLKLGKLTH